MTPPAFARRLIPRRLFLLPMGILCVVLMTASTTRADGCYVLDPSSPDNQPYIGRSITLGGLGHMPTNSVLADDLSISTLGRLAVLSGPFVSLQESRIAKDPNCASWGGRDKVRHAAIFFATTLGLQLFIESTFNVSKTRAFLLSAALAGAVGVGKEIYDWKISDKDCFSEQDLLANAGGILSAGFVIMISN